MLILKIGGGRGINIEGVAQDLATVSEPVIVVHGANAWRDELAAKLGVAVEVVSSVRGYDSVLSTEASLDVLMMAYAGLRNKRIVEAFQRHQIRAVGLSGLDGRSIQGRRNSGIQCPQGEKIVIRRDLSGKPRQVNAELLGLLLSHGYVPVLTVPISDENGFAISADNDDVVTALHATFRATTIVSMIEAPGFLKDAADPSSLLPHLSRRDLMDLEERSSGRMKRKLHAFVRLLQEHPARIILGDGRRAHPFRDAMSGRGTVIE